MAQRFNEDTDGPVPDTLGYYHDNMIFLGLFAAILWIRSNMLMFSCTITQAFYEADDGQKGWLSAEDYKVGMVMLMGYKPSKVNLHVLTVEPLFCSHLERSPSF